MFNIFKTTSRDTFKVGQHYQWDTTEGLFNVYIINLDIDISNKKKQIVGISLTDKNNEVYAGHLPVDADALTKSKLVLISENTDTSFIDKGGYDIWKEDYVLGKARYWSIALDKILETMPKPGLTIMRLDKPEMRDSRIIKYKDIQVKMIFNENSDQKMGCFAPNSRETKLPRFEQVMNQFPFVIVEEIVIHDQVIKVGYFDYSEAINKQYDEEMVSFNSDEIDTPTYECLRRIRHLGSEQIMDLKTNGASGINDIFISLDKDIYHCEITAPGFKAYEIDRVSAEVFIDALVKTYAVVKAKSESI